MATGDRDDMLARIKAVLPPWFGGTTPILDGLLTGAAGLLAYGYDLIGFVRAQTRRPSRTGGWLDLEGWDFFGARFRRRAAETDDVWRARILPEILRERGTRKGLAQAVRDLTGRDPEIIEFTNPQDCGSYGGGYIGYGLAGHYGSILAHTQLLLTAYRPATTGIPEIPGYGSLTTAYGHVLAGYGVTGKYASRSDITGAIPDALIFQTVAETQAAGVTAWTRIANGPVDLTLRADFGLPQNTQYLPFFF